MRTLAKFAALSCGLALAVAAQAEPARTGEVGYTRGALGYDALMAGDLPRAERQIADARDVASNDPAQMINLAYIHMQTGRLQSARALFEAVRDQRDHFMVELANGEVADTRVVAQRALVRLNRAAYAAR